MGTDTNQAPQAPSPGQLAGLSHAVNEAITRVAEQAEAAQAAGRSAMAADLWEAERALRTARRRLSRAQNS